jgi:hypothetical protein
MTKTQQEAVERTHAQTERQIGLLALAYWPRKRRPR